MHRTARRALCAAGLVAALTGLAVDAVAYERVVRRLDESAGLVVSEVLKLAQDHRGLIWIGTSGGLMRYDGRTLMRWAPDSLRHATVVLNADTTGHVLVGGLGEPLRLLTASGAALLPGPDGRAITGWLHAGLGVEGGITVVFPDTLWTRDLNGRWSGRSRAEFGNARFVGVWCDSTDAMVVSTDAGLWVARRGAAPRFLAPIHAAARVVRYPGNRLVALTRDGKLYLLREGAAPQLLAAGEAHGRGLAVRGREIFASIDQYILRVVPGRPPEVIAPQPGVPTGRPILVDRDGSLWIGTYQGVVQIPEPSTQVWTDADGLPSPPHAFFVTGNAEGIWVCTWYGATWLRGMPTTTATIAATTAATVPPTGGASRMEVRPLGNISGSIAQDGRGGLWWARVDQGFVHHGGGREQFFPRPGVHRIAASARRANGELWLLTEDGPFLVGAAGQGAPRAVAAAPPAAWGETWRDLWTTALVEDRAGRVWIARDNEVACASADSLASGRAVTWRVETLPGPGEVTTCLEMPGGDLWASSSEGGLFRRHGGRWEEHPSSRSLPSPRIYALVPSPSGGVWVLSDGDLLRVRERTDLAAGWEVLESLTQWQGLPTQQAAGLYESPNGDVWLASLAGLVHVPAEVRRVERAAPQVELAEVVLDGRTLPLDQAIVLPADRNRLELRFAALSYRDPGLLRYQVRLRPGVPWADARDPDVHFIDLAPGRYAPEVRASLDGVHWSNPPARLEFRVRPPWWRTPWALLAAGLLAAGLLYAAHRIRVAFLLRLEHQRTRIAMDLHDEMGSGLGSIGILAGLVSRDTVDEPTRRRLAREIERAAGDLGGTLGDVVRSLRSGADTLKDFALRLSERGARLFPAAPPEFTVEFPERWPGVRLPFEVRRQLQLIALEALHNAARHACARRVTLGLAPLGHDGCWRLWVADDGRGLAADAGTDAAAAAAGVGPEVGLDRAVGGHGLRNMRRRAEAIGAGFECESAPGRGTRITVTFDPRARQGSHDRALRPDGAP